MYTHYERGFKNTSFAIGYLFDDRVCFEGGEHFADLSLSVILADRGQKTQEYLVVQLKVHVVLVVGGPVW